MTEPLYTYVRGKGWQPDRSATYKIIKQNETYALMRVLDVPEGVPRSRWIETDNDSLEYVIVHRAGEAFPQKGPRSSWGALPDSNLKCLVRLKDLP